MTGTHILKSALHRFHRDERGSFTVEAVVIFPLLVWAYTAMFVFFDAYKTENLTVKAAYTVADMISREVRPIDANYIDGMNSIFGFLTGADPQNDLRISVVTTIVGPSGQPELELVWTHSTNLTQLPELTNTLEIEDRIPMLAIGDQLIIVEAIMGWQPAFNAGLPARNLYELVVAKPRFGSGRVLWNDGEVPVAMTGGY